MDIGSIKIEQNDDEDYEPLDGASDSEQDSEHSSFNTNDGEHKHLTRSVKKVVEKDCACSCKYSKMFQCNKCEAMFVNKEHFDDHLTKQHPELLLFQCTGCTHTFISRLLLETHFQTHSDPKHNCSKCGQYFTDKRELISHKKTHTELSTPKPKKFHECLICGKVFKKSSDLKRHTFTHTKDKPFKCEKCPRSFGEKYKLEKHKLVHEKQEGEEGGKMRRMDDLIPGEVFHCTYCPREFVNRHLCDKHVMTHADERHNCPVCGKYFLVTGEYWVVPSCY